MRRKISGSWRRTQSNFGAVNPGIARLPVMSRERGSSRSSSRHSSSERPSFHKMAGRSGLSALSSKVAPCICPLKPMALTAPRSFPGKAHTASMVARHQESGSCSDHKGCGRSTVSGAEVCATIRSLPSIRTAFTLDVPTSIPRNMASAIPQLAFGRLRAESRPFRPLPAPLLALSYSSARRRKPANRRAEGQKGWVSPSLSSRPRIASKPVAG